MNLTLTSKHLGVALQSQNFEPVSNVSPRSNLIYPRIQQELIFKNFNLNGSNFIYF